MSKNAIKKMSLKKRDELFNYIIPMSDREVDPIVKNSLKDMFGKPNNEIEDDLAKLIGDIRYFSLTSGFILSTLCIILSQIETNVGNDERINSKRNDL
jgi:hypothetical protein